VTEGNRSRAPAAKRGRATSARGNPRGVSDYGVDALAFGVHPDDNPFPEAHAFEPLVP